MSSHREAPEISKDPVADNTDVYAFVSPKKPTYVTLIANFIPLQKPDGGPNFYEFGDDVLYEIKIANKGKATADVVYQFRFHTKIRNKKTFLYNTGRINSLGDSQWNRPQFYSVTRVKNGRKTVLGRDLRCPPVNVGPRSTPDYENNLGNPARHRLGLRTVFAGQRADGFHVDLGAIFDLGTLRPFSPGAPGPVGRGDGRGRLHQDLQRAQHRDRGADQRGHPLRQQAHATRGARRRDRRLGDRQPSQVAHPEREDRQDRGPRPLAAGLPPGQPAVQRGHRPDGREGQVERGLPRRATRPTRSTSTARSWPRCCRCSTRGCSRTSRSTPSRGRT